MGTAQLCFFLSVILHAWVCSLVPDFFCSVQAECSSKALEIVFLLLQPLETMVTIGTSTSITWQNRTVAVPNDLLVEIGETKYLKIQPSNRIMMKLLLGSRTAGSLTSSPGLQKLKEAREEALAESFKKDDAKKRGAGDLFPDAKKTKIKVTCPTVDFVLVDGIQIGVQSKHRSSMDLLILLEPDSLEQVFKRITEDSCVLRRVYKCFGCALKCI